MNGLRRRCVCGHGYGVHEAVRTPLFIRRGGVEFAETIGEQRETCTGYPDKMRRDGRLCDCRGFEEVSS